MQETQKHTLIITHSGPCRGSCGSPVPAFEELRSSGRGNGGGAGQDKHLGNQHLRHEILATSTDHMALVCGTAYLCNHYFHLSDEKRLALKSNLFQVTARGQTEEPGFRSKPANSKPDLSLSQPAAHLR